MHADKILHAFLGLVAAVIAATIVAHASQGRALPAILAGLFTAVALGLGKEYGDYAHGDRWDWLDLAATLGGGIIGSMTGFAALAL